ncbi:WD40-like Beta Propeller Repeat [Alteribacillus persepolensis]|uniref:WD40-like Beta Propeller Repeat n=1 Tax=Alteribacillus persepolensis TaxID=568899 RepID=A0A1G8EBN9_9BACI|nr:hypothetical protein [Alteribacillus persepolensis]SDH67301.1 WD40-like Beta Propeller Repeat [Alteribacillus persepolensis]
MKGGDHIKHNRVLLSLIGIFAFLFVAAVAYSLFSDQDAYKHHTGLGEAISISPADTDIVFSYYRNGSEAIYTGDMEGKQTKQITKPKERNHRKPQFSPDGESLLYLAADSDGIQTIHYRPEWRHGETVQLTTADTHVFDAVFSPDGSTVYYIGMPSEDFQKLEGQKENGMDLHAVTTADSNSEQLTDQDAFVMNDLSVSADGTTLYYTAFHDQHQELFAYDVKSGDEHIFLDEHITDDIYHPVLSPDENRLAYTAVADESANGTFQYELFLLDMASGDTNRLTDLNTSVTSPVFFHEKDRIAFLVQNNWPREPSSYDIMTVDSNGEELAPLELNFPEPGNSISAGKIADSLVHPMTIMILYLALFGLLTIYYHARTRRTYLPATVSTILTGVILLGSFIAAAAINAWAGIGLFMLTIGTAICTAVLFIFAWMYRQVMKHT